MPLLKTRIKNDFIEWRVNLMKVVDIEKIKI
jgi:hypothetical protein